MTGVCVFFHGLLGLCDLSLLGGEVIVCVCLLSWFVGVV